MQGYYFNTNNPYRDWPNAFAEGQEKAREGDLNAAVLLLEAAILQDPQDSEVILNLYMSSCLCRFSNQTPIWIMFMSGFTSQGKVLESL